MYTFITEGNHESKKTKGINKNAVADELKFEDYKNILFNRSCMRHETNRIQSKVHNPGSSRINKTYLSPNGDKKYILKDGHSRLSHFHKSSQ